MRGAIALVVVVCAGFLLQSADWLPFASVASLDPFAPLDLDPACVAGDPRQASLLAVGDTGQPPSLFRALDIQLAVAGAMREEHRSRPVDALILLGDNFYPDGLRSVEMAQRLRDNLARPYCTFLARSAPRFGELAEACPVAPGEGRPVPVFSVLGNHDYGSPESPKLQREVVPEFIAGWRSTAALVESAELPGGISLVLINSPELHRSRKYELLEKALRGSRGPWRILVAHHPMLEGGDPWDQQYAAEIRRAVEKTGRSVHLLLAGHEHNLQVAIPSDHPVPLQLVAGSGSRIRASNHEVLGRQLEWLRAGFARVDLVEDGRGPRLIATLVATRKYPFEFWRPARAVGCWSVDGEGRVERLDARGM